MTADAENVFTPMMSEELLAELYSDPDMRPCGAGAPPGNARVVPGGLRISGRWRYASGCEDAPWALVVVAVTDGDQLVWVSAVVLPTTELRIERNWNMAGLNGTGSHEIAADDVYVPDARVVELPIGPNGMPEIAANPVATLTNHLCLIGPMLGAARGALDLVGTALTTRRPPYSAYESLADSSAAVEQYARAAHLQRGAFRRVLAAAADVDDAAAGTTNLTDATRDALALDVAVSCRELRESVDLLLDLHGSSGFDSANSLQRFWRDLHVGTRHALFTSYLSLDNYTRSLLETRPDGREYGRG